MTITRYVFERDAVEKHAASGTIPRMATALFDSDRDLARCAIVHDFAGEHPGIFKIVTPFYTVPISVQAAIRAVAPFAARLEFSGEIE
jgi:hypothetical protein